MKTTSMTKKEAVSRIGDLADKADNLLAATVLPVPDSLHIQGLKGGMRQIKEELRDCYRALSGEDPWEGT